ncbi:MAG: helix-turn-helix transcriptional regulator, partial [Spirochaetota bacterium]
HELVAPLGTSDRAPALRLPYSREVRGTLERMLSVLRRRDVANGLEITGLLYELFALLARAREASSTPARPVRTTAVDLVEEARRFVQQNYQREIDVADVIRHIGIDRSHFSRVFREREGVSLRSYLISTRMERAMRLLAETDLAVRAVASSVGYRTYESFERRFRDYFGRSPSQARSRSESDSPRSRRRPSDSRSMP